MRELYLDNGNENFKFSDTKTEIKLSAFDNGKPASLTEDVKVRVKNNFEYVLEVSASVTGNQAVIASGKLAKLPVGSYLLELWDTTVGGTAIYPSDGFVAIQINANVTGLSDAVAAYSSNEPVGQQPEATSVAEGDYLYVWQSNALKRVSAKNLADSAAILAQTQTGAGGHNATYRGKNLGSTLTGTQAAAIKAGTFDDLFIGDYWTISGVTYRIAAFDYYLNTGDAACTAHHVVIVPDASLYTAKMNETNTTDGAYVGSEMYKTGLSKAKGTITAAFGSPHLLAHRNYLQNACTNGVPTGAAWFDSTVELMTEQNVYGAQVMGALPAGGTVSPWYGNGNHNYLVDKSQFPLFAFRPDLIVSPQQWFWLRTVVSDAAFVTVDGYGYASCGTANSSGGVRPAFSIC